MLDIEQIKDFEQIKIVCNPHRLAILRLLMAGPAIRLGWIKDGVAFLLQQQTDWYTEFLDLMDEVEETEEMED